MNSEKVNILIVEDESIVAMDLAAGLEMDGYNIVGIADNSEEAEELFKNNPVDIVLMDVQIIGDTDGIDTADKLLKIRYVPIIFLTAFTDQKTVDRVKQICPAAFLSKPYSISNVRISIELALSNFAIAKDVKAGGKVVSMPAPKENKADIEKETILQLNDFIFIKENYRFIKINTVDIQYLESSGNYVNIVCGTRKFVVRMQMGQLLEKLILKTITRIHKSYAVNLQAISSFTDQEVTIDKLELPIGKSYKEDFLHHFHMR
jgi:DNA-binding LytR/AlgR family response regulator